MRQHIHMLNPATVLSYILTTQENTGVRFQPNSFTLYWVLLKRICNTRHHLIINYVCVVLQNTVITGVLLDWQILLQAESTLANFVASCPKSSALARNRNGTRTLPSGITEIPSIVDEK